MNLVNKTDSQLEGLHANLKGRVKIADNAAKEAGESAMKHGNHLKTLQDEEFQRKYFEREIEKFTKFRDERNKVRERFEANLAKLRTELEEVEDEIAKRKQEAA